MKRSICFKSESVSDCTRSKKPRLHPPLSYFNRPKKIWVAATHTRNYMIKDPLVDWLKLINRRGTRNTPVYQKAEGFTKFIMNKGVEFEGELVRYINHYKLPIVTVSEYYNKKGVDKTIELMKKGVAVLHSAPVVDKSDNTGGIIDLLVRSDYLDKLIDECPLTTEEKVISAPKLNGRYHYVVIDIKFSTLSLRADGKLLLNSGSYPAYKAQTWIYTKAVGKIQGYTSQYAYIMGRRWRCTSKTIKYKNYTCLNRLGVIDFRGVDREYIDRVKNALQWVRDVKKYGQSWSLDPPTRPELYPNMCVDSGEWTREKEKIAERLGEITTVWYCGIKHREEALDNGISSWRDPKCTCENINMNGTRAPIVDKIMAINRQKVDKIWPNRIESDMYDWKRECNEIFVDFETLSDIFASFDNLPEQPCTDMIFMIGVGWCDNGSWQYINFICNNVSYDEEYRIMSEFITFIIRRKYPKLYHWVAESRFWSAAENRQFDLALHENNIEKKDHILDDWKLDQWCDMCELFKNEPIVLKGCFKFGLKTIATSMRNHGMIKSRIESTCDSGMTAMITAWKCYENDSNPANSSVMKDISKYNEFDCKVLWEIISYLRKQHS